MYLAGLEEQGIIGGKGNQNATASTGNPGKPVEVDYAGGAPLPSGFKTRRAG